METSHGVLDFGTAAWDAEYAARVAAVMRQVTAAGVRVYWVGQPVARSSSYSHRMAALDAIYRAQAARHAGVTYVDSWPLFTDSHGGYAAYLPTSSGLTLMRLPDGIHLTRAGGDRLARAVMALVVRKGVLQGVWVRNHCGIGPSGWLRPLTTVPDTTTVRAALCRAMERPLSHRMDPMACVDESGVVTGVLAVDALVGAML